MRFLSTGFAVAIFIMAAAAAPSRQDSQFLTCDNDSCLLKCQEAGARWGYCGSVLEGTCYCTKTKPGDADHDAKKTEGEANGKAWKLET
ncbi:hypothetical protein BDV26DRAFT_297797 [Aspergillus bertholletiae]|uniref:Invertebrate defensins family profile domain-containing protein n=1 Tax=Aspergillus bertholletiae TaxID=1226010 RepID=A0A5N7ARN6_9EURO|nr:hypothetical protein BDV26DRAFT_297797 [Aspergillus bertholletiae]